MRRDTVEEEAGHTASWGTGLSNLGHTALNKSFGWPSKSHFSVKYRQYFSGRDFVKIHKFQVLALNRFLIDTAVYLLSLSLFLWLLREETSDLGEVHFPALESGQKQKLSPGGFGRGWEISQGVLRGQYPLREELGSCPWNVGATRVDLSLQEGGPRNSIPQWLQRQSTENNFLTQAPIFYI